MAMIYAARELSVNGAGIGRYRYVGMSDENENVVHALCDCQNGHATEDEAIECPKVVERRDKMLGRDIGSLETRAEATRRELAELEAKIAEKKQR